MSANVDMLVMLIEQRRDQILKANNVETNSPQYEWFIKIYEDTCELIRQYGPTVL